ncbi:MAG: hypothetical protein WCJ74_03250, partial [bacterium]
MLNLLPKEYKNKIKSEYLFRFITILLVGLVLIDIFFLFALFPSYTVVNFRKNIAEETSRALKNSDKAKDRNIVLANIKDLEDRMRVVETITSDRPTDYINKALELQSKNIFVENISYTKRENKQKEIVLEGVAMSRTSLIDFSKKVKLSQWSTSSDIPLSNLANDKNIPFLVILT